MPHNGPLLSDACGTYFAKAVALWPPVLQGCSPELQAGSPELPGFWPRFLGGPDGNAFTVSFGRGCGKLASATTNSAPDWLLAGGRCGGAFTGSFCLGSGTCGGSPRRGSCRSGRWPAIAPSSGSGAPVSSNGYGGDAVRASTSASESDPVNRSGAMSLNVLLAMMFEGLLLGDSPPVSRQTILGLSYAMVASACAIIRLAMANAATDSSLVSSLKIYNKFKL